MPSRPPMQRTVVRYGLAAGALMSAMLVATLPLHDRLSQDQTLLIGYATMVASFLLVFAAVRAYRDRVAGGVVSFGRALAVGTLTVLVASACYTATWEVLYFGIYRHTFMARYEAQALAKLRADGAAPAAVEAKRAEMRRFAKLYDNPAANAGLTFLEPLPVGLLMALLAAGLLRRPRGTAADPDRAPDGAAVLAR